MPATPEAPEPKIPRRLFIIGGAASLSAIAIACGPKADAPPPTDGPTDEPTDDPTTPGEPDDEKEAAVHTTPSDDGEAYGYPDQHALATPGTPAVAGAFIYLTSDAGEFGLTQGTLRLHSFDGGSPAEISGGDIRSWKEDEIVATVPTTAPGGPPYALEIVPVDTSQPGEDVTLNDGTTVRAAVALQVWSADGGQDGYPPVGT
jgi:hypothetical protein